MGALIEGGSLKQPGLVQPNNLNEAWELKSALGSGALYISGGTLLRTQWDAGTVQLPKVLIDLRSIEGIDDIYRAETHIGLGALTSLSRCRRNEYLQVLAPGIQEAVKSIAAPAVRNLATLGGNIASGYGDILPALLVYDAEVVSYDGGSLKVLSLIEWLDLRWGGERSATEIVAEIRIPSSVSAGSPGFRRMGAYRKVGRREAFTPSLVTAGITAIVTDEPRLYGVRIAAGGGSGRPRRLRGAEAVLEGNVYDDRLLPVLYEAVVNDFETYNDPFASEDYKKKTAGNLIVSELWKAFRGVSRPQ